MARAYHIRQSGNELFISADNAERRKLKADGWKKIDSKVAYALVAPIVGSEMSAGYWLRDSFGTWWKPDAVMPSELVDLRVGDRWTRYVESMTPGYLVETRSLIVGAMHMGTYRYSIERGGRQTGYRIEESGSATRESLLEMLASDFPQARYSRIAP